MIRAFSDPRIRDPLIGFAIACCIMALILWLLRPWIEWDFVMALLFSAFSYHPS